MSGNPFFGNKDSKAYKEACETPVEEHTKRMNELHHSDWKPPVNIKNRRRNRR